MGIVRKTNEELPLVTHIQNLIPSIKKTTKIIGGFLRSINHLQMKIDYVQRAYFFFS